MFDFRVLIPGCSAGKLFQVFHNKIASRASFCSSPNWKNSRLLSVCSETRGGCKCFKFTILVEGTDGTLEDMVVVLIQSIIILCSAAAEKD